MMKEEFDIDYVKEKIMICNNCGTSNKENAKFCKNCGSELIEKKDIKSDIEKAKASVKVCSACGAMVNANAAFCKKCGHKLDEGIGRTIDDDDATVFIPMEGANENSGNEAQETATLKTPQNNINNYSNISYDTGLRQNYADMTEDQLPAKFKPIGAWAYFGWTLLFTCVPFGWIVAIIFAVGKTENINLRNFSRSMFCYVAILIIIALLVIGGVGCTASRML